MCFGGCVGNVQVLEIEWVEGVNVDCVGNIICDYGCVSGFVYIQFVDCGGWKILEGELVVVGVDDFVVVIGGDCVG